MHRCTSSRTTWDRYCGGPRRTGNYLRGRYASRRRRHRPRNIHREWTSREYGCYWARLSGSSGEIDDIIANDFTDSPKVIVTIKPSDQYFESEGCGTWTPAPTSTPQSSPLLRQLRTNRFDNGRFG